MKRGLPLTKPWAVIVRPGQHISMSMIFRLKEKPTTQCPGCGKENAGSEFEEIEWYLYINIPLKPERTAANGCCSGNISCGITYRRLVEEQVASSNQSNIPRNANSGHIQLSEPKGPNPLEDSMNDEMQHYTRLHILVKPSIAAVGSGRNSLGFPYHTVLPFSSHRNWQCSHCQQAVMSIKLDTHCINCWRRKDYTARTFW